jgi:DNA-binding NarL/FixJ family response regulator
MKRRRPPPEPEGLHPPDDLRRAPLRFRGDDYVVLSFAKPRWSLPSSLTPAEREVALLIRHGLSNAEIARARGVAVRTVANQVASLFQKLGVGSRLELARRIRG